MFGTPDYQRRMISLERAEATRCGAVPTSFAAIAMARRLRGSVPEAAGAVDPVAASAPPPTAFLLAR